MNIRKSLINALFSAVAAAAPFVASAQTFHVTDLGPVCAWAAINDSGVLAGTCNGDAAVWRNGTVTDLGRLTGGNYAQATGINSLGTIVGDGDTGNFRPNPFITFNGHLLDVDPISGGNARAVGITDTGVIFGNLTKSLSGNTASWNVTMWVQDPGHPDRYKENFLPHYPGGDSKSNGVYATASNKGGQVAGWVTTSVIGQLGGFWNNDASHSVVALQPLQNGYHSIAWALNDLGVAAGESSTLTASSEAVLWQNDAAHTVVDIGTLPGDNTSIAKAINTAGQVVGISSIQGATQRAFFYQNGVIQDLAALVAPAEGRWAFTDVFAINNAGQIIALGSNNGGAPTWALLTPVVP